MKVGLKWRLACGFGFTRRLETSFAPPPGGTKGNEKVWEKSSLRVSGVSSRVPPAVRIPGSAAPEFRKQIRKLFVGRFPYTIYFETRTSEVIVWAVAHGRRKPGYWAAKTLSGPAWPFRQGISEPSATTVHGQQKREESYETGAPIL